MPLNSSTSTRSSGALILTVLLASACQERHGRGTPASYTQPIDAVQDPGSHIEATTYDSVRLLGLAAPDRRAWLHQAITASGRKCDVVLTAVLKAGDDGTDLWRVGCGDGAWLLTFREGAVSFDSCSQSPSVYCTDRLKDLAWR